MDLYWLYFVIPDMIGDPVVKMEWIPNQVGNDGRE